MTAETRPEVAKVETITTRVAEADRGLGVQKEKVDAAVDKAKATLETAELKGREIKEQEQKASDTERKAEVIERGGRG